ncbi:MAG: dolichyl-phosphate beta-glucosyltransferase [Thermoanaerobaculia bacterium]
MAPQLSVVVPAYNEEARIGPTLDRLADFVAGLPGGAEILVVDDGSSDGTSGIAERPQYREARWLRWLRLPENRGKGAALRAGVLASTGDEVLLCDADLSTPIEEYVRLRPRLATVEVVLGSRGLAESRIDRRQPLYRELMGRIFNLAVRALAVGGIKDTQCGFKLLRGEVARSLFADLRIDRFAYDVELIWLARRRGMQVEEVGVTWVDSPASSVHALRDSARMLADLFRIRWLHRGEPTILPAAGAAVRRRV